MASPDRVVPFGALRAFEAAARHLSFKKAAAELFVTPSAISQQIRQLEDHVGAALFRRLTRALELTPEGKAMLPKVREGLGSLSAALTLVRKPVVAGGTPLTVSAPPSFSTRWLLPRLKGFTRAHPDVDLRITSSLEMIDGRGADNGHPLFIEGEGGDTVSIRYGDGDYAGRVDEVFRASYVPVCSPRLLEGPQGLRDVRDLRHHTLIHDDTVPDATVRPNWQEWLARQGVDDLDGRRGPRFTDGSLAIEAAVDGLGIALALRPLVRPDIQSGRLAIPFDSPMPSNYAYYFVTPESRYERPDLAKFRGWLLAEARKEAN